ncbi:MAG: TrkH family potassium uptake protein, partial [Betaproteobacteria bacterium]|nr:TrkH family potassium uptake protein [Betaproteobacteria bacterium]
MFYRLLPVSHVLGGMLMFFSITYLMPIASAVIYNDETLIDFIDAMTISFAAGFILWFG